MKYLVVLVVVAWMFGFSACFARMYPYPVDGIKYADAACPNIVPKYAQEICDWYASQNDLVTKDLTDTLQKNVNKFASIKIKHNRFHWVRLETGCLYLNYVLSFRCTVDEQPCCGIASGFLQYKGTDVKWFRLWLVEAETGKVVYRVDDDFQPFLNKYDIFLREKYGKGE